jgi:rod shape-determining protein MreC
MKKSTVERPLWRPNKTFFVFVMLFAVSFATLLASTRAFLVNFSQTGLALYSGVRNGIYDVGSFFSNTALSIRELASLRKEYAALVEKNARFQRMERDYADIRRENERLRAQLGFSQQLLYRHVAAEITGRDPDSLLSAFSINKGSVAGVKAGLAVIAYQDGRESLVGKVIQAGPFESLVMPLYDSACHEAARLVSSRYQGIVDGQGAPELPLVMRFVPKQAKGEVRIGEIVATSGDGGVFPADITIGRVSRINYEDYETSLELEVTTSVDFSKLEYVFVLIGEPPPSPPVSAATGGAQ